MKTTTTRTALFGPFELNVRSGELRKFGTRMKMGEQAFQILCMLLENPGGNGHSGTVALEALASGRSLTLIMV
jgi:hypothetical protein